MTDDLMTFPHLRDELDCIQIARQLSLEDCRRLFPLVRRAKSSEAREIVTGYLAELMPQPETYAQSKRVRRALKDDNATVQP